MRQKTSAIAKTLLIAAPILLTACGDKGTPTEPPPPGPPGPADPVRSTGQITSQGGTIRLADGTAVVFPQGAVSGSVTVTLEKKTPSTWFDGQDAAERRVISTTATVSSFSKDVEIRVPLPAGMTPADAPYVSGGVLDEATGAVKVEPVSVRMIDDKPFAVFETNHFSSRLIEWLFGATPPTSAEPIIMPYYNQGSSEYCWATALHMVTQAARYGEERSIAQIIGSAGVSEAGVTGIEFRLGPTIAAIVQARTGVRPLRQSWDYVNKDKMRDYLMREIGLNRRPVALFVGQWNHAVVVIGYQNRNTFIIHNPNSTNNNAAGYSIKTWDDIIGTMGVLHNMVTLTVPADIPASSGSVKLNVLNGAFRISTEGEGGGPSAVFDYMWDHERPEGYSYRHVTTGERGDPIAASAKTLSFLSGIELSNSSRTATHHVSVSVDITAAGAEPGMGHYSAYTTVTVPPNGLRSVTLPPVPIDTFRVNTSGPMEYFVTITAMVEGSTVDQQLVKFVIAGITPHLAALDPASGAPGETINLIGKDFGPNATNSSITFNRVKVTEILSWSDTLIKVKVPEGVTTGPVVVTRGLAASNSLAFTVKTPMTISGAIDRSLTNEYAQGVTVEVNGSWTATADSVTLQIDDPLMPIFQTVLNRSTTFAIDLSGRTVTPEVQVVATTDTTRTEYRYLPLECTFEVNTFGSPFGYSSTETAGGVIVDFTFTHRNQSLVVSPFCALYADIVVLDLEDRIISQVRRHFVNGRTIRNFFIEPY